ncbi:calpain-13-like [Protopterus annectens]|uniref:calpain-13-like n=1 Tax=Protopterus annectens TaxID=7888 RepID=UPI001CF93391|nr:calpain-13-like [Protopterus annectens]
MSHRSGKSMPFPGICQKIVPSWQTNMTSDIKNPVPFNNQDFNHLKKTCLQNLSLFEDETFPANMASIGNNVAVLTADQLKKVVWKRPHELVGEGHCPRLFAHGPSRFDIFQGKLGDCWVLAALGSVTFQRESLNKVIPEQEEFSHNYAGIFHFRFWHFGQWNDVVVDDRLPVYENECLYVNAVHINEFWPALLEKAFAKLHGSYQNLHFGRLDEALVDLSGGIKKSIHLEYASKDLWAMMKKAAKSHSLMACSTHGKGVNNILRNGLVASHAYTITGVKMVAYGGTEEELVRLWNPWGRAEWTGRWGDKDDAQWNQLHPELRSKLFTKREDGEFWMSFKDFKEQFNYLHICALCMDFFQPDRKSNWSSVLHRDAWHKGNTAGGCQNNETFWMNPQYKITVTEDNWLANQGQSCNVIVSLMQKPRKKDEHYLHIGFSIFKCEGTKDRLPPQFFAENVTEHFILKHAAEREVTEQYLLKPGAYVLVPSTLKKDEQTEFILRIFFSSKIYTDEPLVRNSVGIKQKTVRESTGNLVVIPKTLKNKYENRNNFEQVFMMYAHNNKEIDASQLQILLNEKVMHEHKYNEVFSIDSCRGIIALMDLNQTGGLNLYEFCRLWKRVMVCEDIFCKIDSRHTGYLDSNELWNGLKAAGISVTKDLLTLLQLRHGDSLKKIHFDSFVCWLLRLECMYKAFGNLTKDGKGIYLKEKEWMHLVMST